MDPPLRLTTPAPLSAPIVCAEPFKSRVAPLATECVLAVDRPLGTVGRNVPALMLVVPLSPKSQARQAIPTSSGSLEQSKSWIVSEIDGASGLTAKRAIGLLMGFSFALTMREVDPIAPTIG